MALQESFTNTLNGCKFVLRQSNEGRWSVKCLTPPPEGETVWAVAWECDGTTEHDVPDEYGFMTPFGETRARELYERYMG